MARSTCVALGALVLAVTGSAPLAAGEAQPLVLVVDASGSMWGKVAGEAKIVGARRVIGELGDRLADGTPLAVVAYGHRREGDCGDIETVLPLGPLDRAQLRSTVQGLVPRGKTPLTAAAKQAFEGAPAGATVVLVTDGLETCDGDPCAAVRTARAAGGDFVFHVIGLDVAKEDVSSLECAAQAGGGLYLSAADANELASALAATVERAADSPAGRLVVRAIRDGQLQDASIVVMPVPRSAGVPISARTYDKAETNPRSIPLADGTYDVRLRAVGIDGATEREERIVIENGASVERTLDLSAGMVEIGATRNGELSDVTWQLFAPADRRKAIATGRTYTKPASNPARANVPVGTYDLVLTALEIAGKPTWEQLAIRVATAAPAVASHDFTSGELAVEVVRGGELVDAVVAVREPGGSGIEQGRTYRAANTNPIRFTLLPGRYEVTISEIRGDERTVSATVEDDQTASIRVDLAEPK